MPVAKHSVAALLEISCYIIGVSSYEIPHLLIFGVALV